MPQHPGLLTYRAFGLDVHSDSEVAGLVPALAAQPGPRVELHRVGAEVLRSRWSGAEVERLGEQRMSDGSLAGAIDRHPELGFRISGVYAGEHAISHDGRRIEWAPEAASRGVAEGWLLSQALPFAAVLQGREVFHASGVVLDGGIVAIAAPSGVGKSSIALRLTLAGGRLVTDDVLALELRGNAVLGHSGHAMVSIRDPELTVLSEHERARLGTPSQEEPGRFRAALEPCAEPLRAFYVLERGDEPGTLAFEPLAPLDPRPLLAHTFNCIVTTPERLRLHLETCATIAHSCVVARVRIPSNVGASEAAAGIAEHARASVGAALA